MVLGEWRTRLLALAQGGGKLEKLLLPALVVVVVAAVSAILWYVLRGTGNPPPPQPKTLWFQCEQCQNQWEVPTEDAREAFRAFVAAGGAKEPMQYNHLLDCPKCKAKKSGLQMVTCPKCQTKFVPDWVLKKEPAPRDAICPKCSTDYEQYWIERTKG